MSGFRIDDLPISLYRSNHDPENHRYHHHRHQQLHYLFFFHFRLDQQFLNQSMKLFIHLLKAMPSLNQFAIENVCISSR